MSLTAHADQTPESRGMDARAPAALGREHWSPQTSQFICAVLASRMHPEQAFRSCLGILSLSKQYSRSQMETACQMAREAKTLNYLGVKSVLELLPPVSAAEQLPVSVHENIRGNSYYQ